MSGIRKYALIIAATIAVLLISGCAGAYVGVGVHAPGPWVGPYGGGPGVTIGTGRPISSGYYPYKPDAKQVTANINSVNTGQQTSDTK